MHKQAWSVFTFLLFINSILLSHAQQNTTRLWISGTSQVRVHNKWSLHLEAQFRSYEITPNTEQQLARGGINYHINSASFATVGYAYVTNFAFDKEQYEDVQVTENRIWQQYFIRIPYEKSTIENRFRLEQRWLESANKIQYLNRIRYLLRVNIPLIKNIANEKIVSMSFYNEIFLHFSPITFDRNRLALELVYQLNPSLKLQAGYMAQTTNATTNHILLTGVTYNPDLRKK